MFLKIKLFTHTKLNSLNWKLTICIKMDLALNNLQRLICYKTQPTNYLYFLLDFLCKCQLFFYHNNLIFSDVLKVVTWSRWQAWMTKWLIRKPLTSIFKIIGFLSNQYQKGSTLWPCPVNEEKETTPYISFKSRCLSPLIIRFHNSPKNRYPILSVLLLLKRFFIPWRRLNHWAPGWIELLFKLKRNYNVVYLKPLGNKRKQKRWLRFKYYHPSKFKFQYQRILQYKNVYYRNNKVSKVGDRSRE